MQHSLYWQADSRSAAQEMHTFMNFESLLPYRQKSRHVSYPETHEFSQYSQALCNEYLLVLSSHVRLYTKKVKVKVKVELSLCLIN
jgi:hypothetical protein